MSNEANPIRTTKALSCRQSSQSHRLQPPASPHRCEESPAQASRSQHLCWRPSEPCVFGSNASGLTPDWTSACFDSGWTSAMPAGQTLGAWSAQVVIGVASRRRLGIVGLFSPPPPGKPRPLLLHIRTVALHHLSSSPVVVRPQEGSRTRMGSRVRSCSTQTACVPAYRTSRAKVKRHVGVAWLAGGGVMWWWARCKVCKVARALRADRDGPCLAPAGQCQDRPLPRRPGRSRREGAERRSTSTWVHCRLN